MFVSQTTETAGLKQCAGCNARLLERDRFAGMKTSGTQMTTLLDIAGHFNHFDDLGSDGYAGGSTNRSHYRTPGSIN